MQPHSRRVFEALATHATLAGVVVSVLVEVVLLEMHLELEADATQLAAVGPHLDVEECVALPGSH